MLTSGIVDMLTAVAVATGVQYYFQLAGGVERAGRGGVGGRLLVPVFARVWVGWVARCWALRNQAPAPGWVCGCWFFCGCLVVG